VADRYYTGAPLFSFGDGLSLTTFDHNCSCNSSTVAIAASCCCTVANTGERRGDEVVQLYHSVGAAVRLRAEKAHPVPLRRLIDFTRLGIEAREHTKTCFTAPRESFALTDQTGKPVIYPGEHHLIFSRGNGRETSVSFTL